MREVGFNDDSSIQNDILNLEATIHNSTNGVNNEN